MAAVSFSGRKVQVRIEMGTERVDRLFSTCTVFSNKLYYKKVSVVSRQWAVPEGEAICPRDEDGTSRVPVPARSLVLGCGPVRRGAEVYLCAAGWEALVSPQCAKGCCGHGPGEDGYRETSFLNVLLVGQVFREMGRWEIPLFSPFPAGSLLAVALRKWLRWPGAWGWVIFGCSVPSSPLRATKTEFEKKTGCFCPCSSEIRGSGVLELLNVLCKPQKTFSGCTSSV